MGNPEPDRAQGYSPELWRPRGQRDAGPSQLQDEWKAFEAARQKYYEALNAWMLAREDSIEAGLLALPIRDSATIARSALNVDRLATRLSEGCMGVSQAIYSSFRPGPTLQQLATVWRPHGSGEGHPAQSCR